MASEEPTRLNVADMSAPTRQHVARHVGVSVILGGGNPRHNANICSQDEGHACLKHVEDATDRLPRLLLVRLRFWNKGAALPVICALVAWPQNALFVFSVEWLCGDFNKQDPQFLELILAWPTATGTPMSNAEIAAEALAGNVVFSDVVRSWF